MNRIIALLLFSFIWIQVQAQTIFPENNDIPGWEKFEDRLHYSKKNLFDYIDGGAEIFLEFGFNDLTIQSYKKGDDEITVELYQMEGPASAMGIYLMRSGKEQPVKGITARNTGNRFQFMVLRGNYFIQINNFLGGEHLIPEMIRFTQYIIKNIPPAATPKIYEYLPQQNLIPGSELLIRGTYSLQPIYTFGEGDILQLGGTVFGVVGDYESNEEGRYTLIRIPYPTKKDADEAFINLNKNLDSYLNILKKWDGGFIFEDYRAKFGIVEKKNLMIEIKIDCQIEPSRTN